jgi:hypothetical protein
MRNPTDNSLTRHGQGCTVAGKRCQSVPAEVSEMWEQYEDGHCLAGKECHLNYWLQLAMQHVTAVCTAYQYILFFMVFKLWSFCIPEKHLPYDTGPEVKHIQMVIHLLSSCLGTCLAKTL